MLAIKFTSLLYIKALLLRFTLKYFLMLLLISAAGDKREDKRVIPQLSGAPPRIQLQLINTTIERSYRSETEDIYVEAFPLKLFLLVPASSCILKIEL